MRQTNRCKLNFFFLAVMTLQILLSHRASGYHDDRVVSYRNPLSCTIRLCETMKS